MAVLTELNIAILPLKAAKLATAPTTAAPSNLKTFAFFSAKSNNFPRIGTLSPIEAKSSPKASFT